MNGSWNGLSILLFSRWAFDWMWGCANPFLCPENPMRMWGPNDHFGVDSFQFKMSDDRLPSIDKLSAHWSIWKCNWLGSCGSCVRELKLFRCKLLLSRLRTSRSKLHAFFRFWGTWSAMAIYIGSLHRTLQCYSRHGMHWSDRSNSPLYSTSCRARAAEVMLLERSQVHSRLARQFFRTVDSLGRRTPWATLIELGKVYYSVGVMYNCLI